MKFLKYPRTRHIAGSRNQPSDDDLTDEPFAVIEGRHLVVEEKIDGANAGISFSSDGELQLQSRGHYLVGGAREKHFALFKTWATTHTRVLRERLSTRYVAFGEWALAKHTIFYDRLPHYFLEFDVYDRESDTFLSTDRRREFWRGSPVVSVPVIHEGAVAGTGALRALIRPALYKSEDWRDAMVAAAGDAGVDRETVQRETDRSDCSEGLYIKVEEHGVVRGRYKFVRQSFLTSVVDSGSHWLHRPIIRNQLRSDVDLFGEGAK